MEQGETAIAFFSRMLPTFDRIYFWSIFILGAAALTLIAISLIRSEPKRKNQTEPKGEGEGTETPSGEKTQTYMATVQLIMHAENTSWNRISSFLIANSILMLAWASIFISSNPTDKGAILIAMSTAGLVFSLAWAPFGTRGRRYLAKFLEIATVLEKKRRHARPITEVNRLEFQQTFHSLEKFCRSWHLVVIVPLTFAGVFYLLLLKSVWLLHP
jgi:hypothetical protein